MASDDPSMLAFASIAKPPPTMAELGVVPCDIDTLATEPPALSAKAVDEEPLLPSPTNATPPPELAAPPVLAVEPPPEVRLAPAAPVAPAAGSVVVAPAVCPVAPSAPVAAASVVAAAAAAARQTTAGAGTYFDCRECGFRLGPWHDSSTGLLTDGRLAHKTEAVCDGCALDAARAKLRNKYFCMHCGMFCKKDKFARNHEEVRADGLTRCAPGRVADRTRKWQPAHAALVATRDPRTDAELTAVLAELHAIGATDVDLRQLKRKLEQIRAKANKASGSGGAGGASPSAAAAGARVGAPRRAPASDSAILTAAIGAVASGAAAARAAERGDGLSEVTNTQAAPDGAASGAAAASDSAGGEEDPEEALPPKKRARAARKPKPAAAAPAPAAT